ncbi:MAG: sensor domain-containing protein [Salinirussus sp.]
MSQSTQLGTVDPGGRSLARRVFGVGFRKETYANLAYLLARFPLGIAYFTILVTGLSLGLSLVPVVVGVPILAGVLGLAGYIGVVEAELLARLRGRDVSHEPADPGELPVTAYLKTVATDPRNYLLVAFGLGSFVVGVHLFAAITVVFSLGVALAAAPLLYQAPGVEYGLAQTAGTVELGPVSVDAGAIAGPSVSTLPEALAVSLLGVVVCLVGLHAVNLTAWLFGALTERVL